MQVNVLLACMNSADFWMEKKWMIVASVDGLVVFIYEIRWDPKSIDGKVLFKIY